MPEFDVSRRPLAHVSTFTFTRHQWFSIVYESFQVMEMKLSISIQQVGLKCLHPPK
ncbi:hypothetical protein BgiMline_009286, partial [Biomphalaria glabrata]